MNEYISDLFEPNSVEQFPEEFFGSFVGELNWITVNSSPYAPDQSNIGPSNDVDKSKEVFHNANSLPTPTLSGTYSRSDSQASVDNVEFRGNMSSGKEAVLYQCSFPGCSKRFTRRDNVKYHLRTHDTHRPRPFACTDCDKTYFRAIDLSRHFRVTHEKLKPYICNICCQTYTRKEALKRHTDRSHSQTFQ